jgi:uncharacterized phage-associated protein
MSIRFKTNAQKALEVIVWFASREPGVGFHRILKLLFFADKYHLNRYGRPIVGDQYNALPYGPVAQTTYDILKRDPLALSLVDDLDLPFEVKAGHHVHALREPNLRKLSESDVEALSHAWDKYGRFSFDLLTRVSHDDPAYRLAAGQTMAYEDFIEADAPERDQIIQDLRDEASRLRI